MSRVTWGQGDQRCTVLVLATQRRGCLPVAPRVMTPDLGGQYCESTVVLRLKTQGNTL